MTKSILDQAFRYVNAASTNIAETFRKERIRLKREAERQAVADAEAREKVKQIGRKAAK